MRNQYGQRLRSMVAAGFSVETVIEMHDVDAFEQEVSAYPSVTMLRRESQGPAILATAKRGFDETGARRVRIWASRKQDLRLSDPTFEAARLPTWFGDVVVVAERLARATGPSGSPGARPTGAGGRQDGNPGRHRCRERCGSRVRRQGPDAVEDDRVCRWRWRAIRLGGRLRWSGHYLVDPWDGDTGALVSLDDYPQLKAYFEDKRGGSTEAQRRRQATTAVVPHDRPGRPLRSRASQSS